MKIWNIPMLLYAVMEIYQPDVLLHVPSNEEWFVNNSYA